MDGKKLAIEEKLTKTLGISIYSALMGKSFVLINKWKNIWKKILKWNVLQMLHIFIFHLTKYFSLILKLHFFFWYIPVPNCPFYTAVPNCPGAKLSSFHCGAKLSLLHCGAKLSWCQIVLFYTTVPNCPRCQIVLFYAVVPNCPPNMGGAKLSEVP